jgi:hypothetical protein
MARGELEERGSVPVPDPTKLTTDAVALAKKELTSFFDVQVSGIKSDLAKLWAAIEAIPGLSEEQIKHLRELIEEKFVGVKTEFTMRDIALAAAFKAAEAAVKSQNESNTLAIDKAGAAFTKQIDSLDEKIDDLKARISDLSRKDWATVGAYIVGAIGIAALIVAGITWHHG